MSPKANPYTEMFSKEAIKMIINGYKEIIENFLIASNYAGISFGNAGVGAVHALSYPLGATYHVPHGEANYQFFIEVFKCYNGKIKEVNSLLREVLNLKCEDDVYKELEVLLENLINKKKLSSYGMKEEEIDIFTNSVIETQQRLLANNYVELSKEEISKLYTSLY